MASWQGPVQYMPWAQQHLKLSICIWQCLLWHPWQQPVCVVKLNSSQSPKLSIWHPSNPQYVCGVRLKGFRIWSARCHSCWEIDFAASERSEQLSNWATEQLSKSVWRILYIFQYLGFIFLKPERNIRFICPAITDWAFLVLEVLQLTTDNQTNWVWEQSGARPALEQHGWGSLQSSSVLVSTW